MVSLLTFIFYWLRKRILFLPKSLAVRCFSQTSSFRMDYREGFFIFPWRLSKMFSRLQGRFCFYMQSRTSYFVSGFYYGSFLFLLYFYLRFFGYFPFYSFGAFAAFPFSTFGSFFDFFYLDLEASFFSTLNSEVSSESLIISPCYPKFIFKLKSSQIITTHIDIHKIQMQKTTQNQYV